MGELRQAWDEVTLERSRGEDLRRNAVAEQEHRFEADAQQNAAALKVCQDELAAERLQVEHLKASLAANANQSTVTTKEQNPFFADPAKAGQTRMEARSCSSSSRFALVEPAPDPSPEPTCSPPRETANSRLAALAEQRRRHAEELRKHTEKLQKRAEAHGRPVPFQL